ncbi:MAG: transposase [Phycisphaeraceae bacterium]|nr:transposase [Phycisphaeraceae bacterium]
MAKELVSEDLWRAAEPLLPRPRPRTSAGGRPPVDSRAALRGIIFVLRTGIPWQALPREAFGVSGSSCWRRFKEWWKSGVWTRLHQELLRVFKFAVGIDHRAVVDSQSVRALREDRARARTRRTVQNAAANAISRPMAPVSS